MYEPQVNDYVRWTTALGMVHEGWVYFKASPVEPKRGWSTPSRRTLRRKGSAACGSPTTPTSQASQL